MGFRNTETRLHRPETGKPLTRSWTDAVTNNLNHESTTPGGFSEGPNLNPSHPSPYINPVTLRVKNHTNAPQEMFSVLKITTPEETNPNAFPHILRSQQNAIYGETPTGDCHESVAITTYYMDPETELPCIVSGPSPVKILFETEESLTFPFAIPIYGDTTKLKASPFGRIKILWHEETQQTPTCSQPIVLYSWVNLGIQCEWSFWKLKADLACCSGALAQLCDECGAVINEDCPIEAMIYAPPGQTLCSCEDSCAMWKAGDIVPALWYEYLCKWVTIPNFNVNLEEKEMQVVTGLSITGGTIRPTENYNTVITDIVFNTNNVTLDGFQDQTVSCSGSLNFGNDAKATGKLEGTATLGSEETKIRLPIVSECDGVSISNARLTSAGDIRLSGTPQDAQVTVPLSGVTLDVDGDIDDGATATGSVTVQGRASLGGSCSIDGEDLPDLDVTGTVTVSGEATLNGNVTVGQNAISLTTTQKTVMTGVSSHNAKTFETDQVTLKIPPLSGTITGTLNNTHTTQVQFSNLTVTLDLSSIFEEFDAVKDDSFKFENCELTWETEKAIKLKSGQSLASISASLSGSINIPSDVTCNYDFNSSATEKTITGVKNVASATITPTTTTFNLPTAATLDGSKLTISGTGTMETEGTIHATATWPENTVLEGTSHVEGNISLTNNSVSLGVTGTVSGTASGDSGDVAEGTATFTEPITVSGPLYFSSGVTLSGTFSRRCAEYAEGVISGVPFSTSDNVSLNLSGSIVDNRTCTVQVPTTIKWGDEDYPWVDIDTARVPFPGVELTGATISGVTDTITYLACADCPESEEEEEE